MRIKPALDIIAALVLIILFVPLLILVALLVRLDSPGPAIYRQARIGRLGKQFTMLKFRTMKIGTPILSTEDMQKQAAIPFTRLGPFLRKSNLDELPQLINILRGQMSFIGPRPALPTQVDVITLREKSGVHFLRPGITGLAQAIGRDDLDNETKVNYDTQYYRKMSFLSDVKILFLTFGAILSARGNK
jgi:lipopolysaccharide/colanic/teichoic acid biosynthesis glycosyltransferase